MDPKVKKDIERQLALGITHSRWQWVNAGRLPCPHKHLNNVKFDVRQGMPFKGEWIFPGGPGCYCSQSPLIPGISD